MTVFPLIDAFLQLSVFTLVTVLTVLIAAGVLDALDYLRHRWQAAGDAEVND